MQYDDSQQQLKDMKVHLNDTSKQFIELKEMTYQKTKECDDLSRTLTKVREDLN